MSTLAAAHLATHQRETYYYKVGVTSLCQSQSAGLAFLNSCGWQLLEISLTTFLKEPAGAFPSLTIIKETHTRTYTDILYLYLYHFTLGDHINRNCTL